MLGGSETGAGLANSENVTPCPTDDASARLLDQDELSSGEQLQTLSNCIESVSYGFKTRNYL